LKWPNVILRVFCSTEVFFESLFGFVGFVILAHILPERKLSIQSDGIDKAMAQSHAILLVL
jgi:phage shock protein PspC (stress-responsive transcriptional regulator)